MAFLLVGYDRVANLSALHVSAADGRGRALVRLESVLHIGIERSLDHAAATHAVLDALLSLYYDVAHGLVTVGVLVGLYVLRPAGYRQARTALVAVNVAALGLFLALPVTPPRLLPGADFVDVVAQSGTWGALTTGSAVARHADQYASMPSLHVAWAFWVVLAVVAATRRRRFRVLAFAHLGVTVLVVLATGNHYLLDAAAGALLSAVAWLAASRATGYRAVAAQTAAYRAAAYRLTACRAAARRVLGVPDARPRLVPVLVRSRLRRQAPRPDVLDSDHSGTIRD